MAHPIVTPSSFLPNIPRCLVALSLDAIENLTCRSRLSSMTSSHSFRLETLP
ncbi:hypothetical protein F2Q69_00027504 [Brassica cretica]|uniref:Uncharacterized protein n=1 Tax=Brassica cretica TaxID=69181 RepID=A0A8S9S6I3_BRACR|nr:hypothetical protein F2Q69_00027504 [Brassica cretica]